MDLGLRDRVALVTGGSRGIGRGIALRLAEEGCRVGICGRSSNTLKKTQAELRSLGVLTSTTVADVTQSGEVERFVQESVERLGGLDIVVANAGGSTGSRFETSTTEDWLHTFDLNLFHAVRLVRAALPHFQLSGRGSALMIASISGWKPTRRNAQYATAKAAEIQLAGVLAQELAPYQVRVNTLSPGSILFADGGWEEFRTNQPERFAEFERQEFPWQRLGTVEEIADVAAFLVSDRARWINGANIPVDGGQNRPSV